MKKWIFICIAALVFSPFSATWAKDTETKKTTKKAINEATNQEFSGPKKVIQEWVAAMKSKNLDKASNFLAPQFVSIHTDGIVRNKADEIALIKQLTIKDYKLSDFKFSQSGSVVVVTYNMDADELLDKEPIDYNSDGRVAVLQKQNNEWLILSYANLDELS